MFFDFDFNFRKDNFLELVQKIQSIRLIPLVAVCDFGPTNRSLLKDLKISAENSVFIHDSLNQPLFFFADFPHMLKLLRNHLLDQGLFLPNGYYLSKTLFKKFLDLDTGELKLCHKISESQLLVKGSERQNVRKAAQLFSNSVASFIFEFLPSEKEGGNFILLINNLFDLFNSTSEKNYLTPFNNAFCGSQDQINLLLSASEHIKNIRVGKIRGEDPIKSRTSLLPFQQGLIQSINSLIGLYKYVSENFEIRYILTYKITQDSLENFFAQMRSIGHSYDHPTPLEFIYRFRILIFMKNFSTIQFSKNCEKERIEEKYITYEIGKEIPPFLQEKKDFQNPQNIRNNALFYLAGYVAKKCKKYSNCSYAFGGYASHDSHSESSPFSKWVCLISKGRLCLPSDLFWNQIQSLESEFSEFFPKKNLSGSSELVPSISFKHPQISIQLVKCFIRSRLYFKLRVLNRKHPVRKNLRKLAKFVS